MKAFKYRIYPTESQKVLLARTFGCCRFVWNKLLAENKEQYEVYRLSGKKEDKPSVNYAALSRRLTQLKHTEGYEWLQEVSAVALQQSVKNLAEAFANSFKLPGRGLPQIKSKHRSRDSSRFTGAVVIRDRKLYLSKDKDGLKVKWTRELPYIPSSYTVSQSSDGKYWVSFVCREVDPVLTNGSGVVGIDLGLKDFIVDSNGLKYTNPKYFTNSQVKLARAQRILSRRTKGSNRRTKARLRVARIFAKITNQRKDYIHKLTRTLVNENQVIGIEDLNVSGMVKDRRVSKSVMDSGFGLFKKFLMYKVDESQFCNLVIMDQWYPSTQTCNMCNYRLIDKERLSLNTREWTCPICNSIHDRDINAALNIRNVAINVINIHKPLGGKILQAPPLQELIHLKPATPGFAQQISYH